MVSVMIKSWKKNPCNGLLISHHKFIISMFTNKFHSRQDIDPSLVQLLFQDLKQYSREGDEIP